MNLKDLLIALAHAPDEPRTEENQFGIGHRLDVGLEIRCIGTPDETGIAPFESKHLIGKLTKVPDAGAVVVPTERCDEATFEFAQEVDHLNPVCKCGQPISI